MRLFPKTHHVACILAVDDDPAIQGLFRQLLRPAGYSVVEAKTGKEALHALEQTQFDVVLLDLSMPDMDGFEILKTARLRWPYLKVVAVSGFLQGDLLRVARYCGAAATLQKPVDHRALLSTIHGVLQA